MTESGFRRVALGMSDAIEGAHMGHPDFRAAGRIFATLRGDKKHGCVMLTPDQQAHFVGDYPDAFTPESGAWGRQGSTRVILAAVDAEVLGEAVTLAWRNAHKKAVARAKKPAPRKPGAPTR